jgi:dsRNA-specific ribonuclease
MSNPIITLSERVQKQFGANIETRVINKRGLDHCPEIQVELKLPTGETFTAWGPNQKEAKKARSTCRD